MNYKLSSITENIEQSEIRAMSIECLKVSGINLAQGICDTETPQIVLSAAEKAIENGLNTYTPYDGIPELKRAIAQKEELFKNLSFDPESEIAITSGATGGFYAATITLLNRGDEAIVFEPHYSYHVSTLQSIGVKVKFVKMNPPNWDYSKKELEELITEKTRLIVINTPSNPTGKIFTESELNFIGELAEKYDLYIFSDEIYEYFTYNARRHISPASIKKLSKRTVLISGFSKTYSVTGWRIGYVAAPKEIIKSLGHLSDLVYVCAPSPLQYGVAKGLEELDNSHYENLKNDHLVKRDMLCDSLKKVGMKPYVPDGAYYILAEASNIPGKNSKEKAMYILDKTGVATVPGNAFYSGNGGENLVRFCFAKKLHVIKNACRRIEETL